MKALKDEYKYHIQMLILLLIMIIITGLCNRAVWREMLFFYLFQVGGIVLPGTALLSVIKVKDSTRLEFLMLSYAAGYAVAIVVYYVSALFSLSSYIGWIYVVIGVLSVFSLIWNRNTVKFKEEAVNKKERNPLCNTIIFNHTIPHFFIFKCISIKFIQDTARRTP